jgi:Predicted metal-dependent phosphoesterases (PHP family)
MIDLHLHTYYSDGTMSPEELVSLAASRGVDTIAITDHDGISGLHEAMEAGQKLGVRVFPGIELSAEDDKGVFMHILGYCFDAENKELKNELEIIRQKRVERNEKLLSALHEIGCNITQEDLKLRKGQDFVGKPIFAMALMKKGYIDHPKEAFKEGRFMRSEAVRRIHREKITAERAIGLITQAGGIAVLAHPMKISHLIHNPEEDFFSELDKLLTKLKVWGLQGMECFYSQHSAEETKHLIEMAKSHGLLITAGSDFHGREIDENIEIGIFPAVPDFNKNKLIEQIDHSFF